MVTTQNFDMNESSAKTTLGMELQDALNAKEEQSQLFVYFVFFAVNKKTNL